MIRVILFSVLFLIFLGYLHFNKQDVSFTKSSDGGLQLVRNVSDKNISAELLSKIKKRLDSLCNFLINKYNSDKKHISSIQRLRNKFNPDNIQESSPSSQYTSYSVNKGEELHFCLRSKDEKQELHPINTLMFVAIHELAHIMSVTLGHNKEFMTNFKFLLENAVEVGVYEKIDYNKNSVDFCGMKITNTPLKNSF